jgi:hypothetical protein
MTQREALCALVQWTIVEIRALCHAGAAQQAAELADAVHNIPREIWGWGGWSRRITRGCLEGYCRKYGGTRDYVRYFDSVFETEDPPIPP